MSAITVKIRRQRVGVMNNKEMYVAHPVRYTQIGEHQLIDMAAKDSGLSEAQVAAALYALEVQIEELLLEGHSVDFGVLGSFRVLMDCKAKEFREDMNARCITRRRILYRPSSRIKTKLNNARVEGFEMNKE